MNLSLEQFFSDFDTLHGASWSALKESKRRRVLDLNSATGNKNTVDSRYLDLAYFE